MGKRNWIGKHLLLWVVLACVLAIYASYTLLRPLPILQPTAKIFATVPATTVSLPWPAYGQSAIGAVGYGVLQTSGSQTPFPTASTAKVLTALAVLKQKPITANGQGPIITLTQADVDMYHRYVAVDGSVAAVSAGEQITEYQMLQGMLLPSANNLAESLADWAFGSVPAFVSFANQYAKQLGLHDTTITDPSGLDASTVSTAHDLTLLGEVAMQNPVITQIVGQASATIPVQGLVRNVNGLLGTAGILGIKTGNNDQDTGAYLFAATHTVDGHTVTIVGAVMGAPSLGKAFSDSLPLIKAGGQHFIATPLLTADESAGSYAVPWRKGVQAHAIAPITFVRWEGAPLKSTVSLIPLQAPVEPTQAVGKLVVTAGPGISPHSYMLYLNQPLTKPSWVWRLLHPFDSN